MRMRLPANARPMWVTVVTRKNADTAKDFNLKTRHVSQTQKKKRAAVAKHARTETGGREKGTKVAFGLNENMGVMIKPIHEILKRRGHLRAGITINNIDRTCEMVWREMPGQIVVQDAFVPHPSVSRRHVIT
jgi:hypothetical protein